MVDCGMADFVAFHRTLAAELQAIKDRVRHLVPGNWPPDGAHKEAVLRSVLRRHLPEHLRVGTGFIVGEPYTSTQIDILIADKAKPSLFLDGEFMVITPDAVRAALEIKTLLSGVAARNALTKLARIQDACNPRHEGRAVWLGLFEYDGGTKRHETILKALQHAHRTTGRSINAVSIGPDSFYLRWRTSDPRIQAGPQGVPMFWRSYTLQGLAASYFLGNLIFACSDRTDDPGSFAWFPLPDQGKELFSQFQIGTTGDVERVRH